MSDKLNPLKEENLISVLTPEEEAEQEILKQDDAVEFILKDLALVGEPIIWSALESAKLNKRVTTVIDYYELKDKEDKIIGYQAWDRTKHITSAGESVSETRAGVIGSRRRGE